jgi:hypothetical protein
MSDAPNPPTPPPAAPQVFEATLGADGAVKKGALIAMAAAVTARRSGNDVVVCGSDLAANRRLAGYIEATANGAGKRCPPHVNAGPLALPHYQPDPRPPKGHTFYETPNRKAV